MRRKWRRFSLIAVGLLALLFVCLPRRGVGPTYGGRRLSEWVAIYGKHVDKGAATAEKEAASDAIRQIGTNGLPFLLQWIDYEPAAWRYNTRQYLPEWLRQNRVVNWFLLADQANVQAADAMRAFAALGPIAAPAIPELVRRINQTNSMAKSNLALLALSGLGPSAVSEMKMIFSDSNRLNFWTLYSLMQMGTNARPALPVLITHLQNTNAVGEAVLCAQILSQLKSDPEIVVPALAESLSLSQEPEVRMMAAQGLGDFDQLARPAIPVLRTALTDTNWHVRYHTTNALLRIAPEAITNTAAH